MNIRLTPRQLNVLKTLSAEADMRPGELVTRWVEERLEAERTGGSGEVQTALAARVEELAGRVAALEGGVRSEPAAPVTAAPLAEPPVSDAPVAMPRRRGRPPKAAAAATTEPDDKRKRGRPRKVATPSGGKRVPLHEEIIAVINERGPQSAADLATAIIERDVFRAPRSGKPLDAATVNSRVSNPVYRSRFKRIGHQIALAEG